MRSKRNEKAPAYRSYDENASVFGQSKKLPDGKIVPQELIDDLKRLWPRDPADGSWIAPYYLDHTHVGRNDKRCPNCDGPHGNGHFSAPTGEPRKTGKVWFGGHLIDRHLMEYDCPVCSMDNFYNALLMRCGVDFDDFDFELLNLPQRQQMFESIHGALSVWSTNRRASGWMNIIGGIGSGKTWASQVVIHKLVSIGLEARYVLATDLAEMPVDAIHAQRHDPDAGPVSQALYEYYRIPFLVIDELFLVRQSNSGGERAFGLQHLIRMLNHRYEHRSKLATIAIWDIDWWHINETDGKTRITPNPILAGDMYPILSRAAQADWMAWTRVPDIRPRIGNRQRQKVYGQDSGDED